MSDEASTPSPSPAPAPAEAETLARSMGWRPLEEFRGDPSKWVDAGTFVSRGEHFIPILRADRDKAQREAAELRAKVDEMSALLRASTEAIEGLKEFQTAATKREVEKARRDWVKQLREAREAGDVEAEVTAQSEILKLDNAVTAAPPPAPAPAPTPSPAAAPDPEFVAWEADNPWFKTDVRKHALAMGIAQELRADPRNASLVGRAFYDRVGAEVEAYLNPGRAAPSKVAGGRPAGSAAGTTVERTYSDLPADAKAACDQFERKLVGPGRAYKDAASWRAKYVADFFQSN